MTLRLGVLGAVALTLGAFMATGPAMAQPVPQGSYQNSCDNESIYGDTLRARCETEDGDFTNSRLDNFDDCVGDISNIDGRLTCTRGDDDPGDDGPGDGRDDDRGDRIPRGSYQQTCQNERVESGDLVADCADRNGRLRHSELANHRFCRGDIRNDNGVLSCRRDDDGDDDYTVPTGTWRSTCRDHRVSGNRLFAECRDRFGRWVETSVDLRGCRQGVANVNGRLVCIVPATLGWRISLYRNIGYTGTGRTFIGDVPDLARYGMANVASSAYLRSGAWQLCTRAYYRGQCVTLRSSAPNFRRLGINDRARSLRRVR
ncbi:MAG: CVNH domain-containing protein [Micropepsaceae bacterium]